MNPIYTLYGNPVILDKHIPKTEVIERTWKERLFTLPWTPFVSYKEIESDRIYKIGNSYYAHPDVYKRLISKN